MSEYVAGKRGRAKRRTRKAFLNAAAELLKDRDFAEISVVDVCEEAGIPRATFYNYFEDKYSLVREAAGDLVEKIFELKLPEEIDLSAAAGELTDLILLYCRTQMEFLAPFFKVGGFMTDSVIESVAVKLYYYCNDHFRADMIAAAVVYGARRWTVGGCVLEREFVKKRILDSVSTR